MQPQLSSGTAYLLWLLCFIGICGGQRFYSGKVGSGLLYLFTCGLFGFGQLIDLALIPGMVRDRNTYLSGRYGGVTPAVTVNIGQLPQVQQPQPAASPANKTAPMQKLLRAAQENGGMLSIAQAAMFTELEPEEVKALLHNAEKLGYAEVTNDDKTGAVRYRFDV
ncbi:TM2 domain-containing protein [Leptolyngbya sp. FACHB-671]|uniref:TM2 domain-containing protein n=1 Tax=Leptolyngbya sp. FACHB-671 TaxID=2692812 RepID=UPI00168A2226|nr:TM2 domain-containing protein [Leptolyngbya sp. FACHB-671]MBD2066165.1 TM2 domain-containing protein [Leptolyngbya sp. FACHB-671]